MNEQSYQNPWKNKMNHQGETNLSKACPRLKQPGRSKKVLLEEVVARCVPEKQKEDFRGITVSIVDDDATTRRTIADWVQQARGFSCVGAHDSGESALAALPAESPSVVLMDINLPGASGIECVRRLKPLLPKTQFVMLTVCGDTEHIFNALAAGASGYLMKRTLRSELLDSIRQVHQGGSPMTCDIARKVVQSFQFQPGKKSDLDVLSAREFEVLLMLARGFRSKEIAESLEISVSTVNTHIRRIYEKLHVNSRTLAVAACAQSIPSCKFWPGWSGAQGSVGLLLHK